MDRESEVARALPEVGLILDADLRAAVITVWATLWAQSGLPDLLSARTSTSCPDAALVEHTRVVTRISAAMADTIIELHGLAVAKDDLLAAALLHDSGKLVELNPDAQRSPLGILYPHAFLGAEAARRQGLPERVASLVLTHTPKLNHPSPFPVEYKILENADQVSAQLLVWRWQDRQSAPT